MRRKFNLWNIQAVVLLLFFKTGGSTSTPFKTADEQLKECQTDCSTLAASHVKEITDLMNNYSKLQKDLEDLTSKSVSDASYRHSRLQEKRNNNLLLRRSLAQTETALNLKFDCFSNTNTLAECHQYCAFPYGFDSCTQTDEQKQFVSRILMDAGWENVLFRYYNRQKGPQEEVKLGTELYQLMNHRRNPHEHQGHRHGHRRRGHHNHEHHLHHHGSRRHGQGYRARGLRRPFSLPVVNDTNICTQFHAATT